MAIPTEKNVAVDNFVSAIFGVNRCDSIVRDECVICREPAVEFRDAISRKEFSISGMCQKCQDKIWG